MKFLVVLAVAIAYASAAAVNDDFNADVVQSIYNLDPDGSYQYKYETSNGISSQAEGSLVNANSEYPSLEVQGSFRYTAPDGQPIEVVYTAGENGYQAQGSHLPVPPPTPEAILRSLAYLAANPPAPEGVRAAVAPKPAYG